MKTTNKNKLKLTNKGKILVLVLAFIVSVVIFNPTTKVNAVENCSDHEFTTRELCIAGGGTWAPDNYQLLAPLPGTDGKPTTAVNVTGGLSGYLNPMIKIFIGLCAVLSVVVIVIGGIEYMTSELSHSKEAGKERIWNAILGLLIALGAYALLYTINPDLLNSDINPPPVKITPAPASTK